MSFNNVSRQVRDDYDFGILVRVSIVSFHFCVPIPQWSRRNRATTARHVWQLCYEECGLQEVV
jgi:hypothetical protein